MSKPPIVIISKDRLRYLDCTLRGLFTTVPTDVPIFIADDGSQNPDLLQYLTTCNEVPILDRPFPNEHSDWQMRIGHIPNLATTHGIADRVTVFLRPVGGIRNIDWALRRAVEITGASHVIKLEDDLVLVPGWYEVLSGQTVDGIVSGFRHFYGRRIVCKRHNAIIERIRRGCTGALMWLLSSSFLASYPPIEDTAIESNDCRYWALCRQMRMGCYVTRRGLCQHVGVESLVYGAKKSYFAGEHLNMRRIDPDLRGPFAL